MQFVTDLPQKGLKMEVVYKNTKRELMPMAAALGCEYEFMMDDNASIDYFFNKSVVIIIENDKIRACPLSHFAGVTNLQVNDTTPFSFECVVQNEEVSV
ncbi:MAG: hypothetical protein EOM76_08470 [Sphingobacteriia bacterium]|nr:hypothetical protein [Sphingobacteriia bacterium]